MKNLITAILLIFLIAAPLSAQSSYESSPNYGKKIAVFGGSFSVIAASDIAKNYWAEMLKCTVVNYGIGGSGFSVKTGIDRYIPLQIEKALKSGEKYDIYILWASTNDCANKVQIKEQNRQIALCVDNIRKVMPQAKVLFFTSLPVPLLDRFSNIDSYVEGQLRVCRQKNVPCLNLFTDSGLNRWNAPDFFSEDKLHLNEAGYNHIKETLSRFIAAN